MSKGLSASGSGAQDSRRCDVLRPEGAVEDRLTSTARSRDRWPRGKHFFRRRPPRRDQSFPAPQPHRRRPSFPAFSDGFGPPFPGCRISFAHRTWGRTPAPGRYPHPNRKKKRNSLVWSCKRTSTKRAIRYFAGVAMQVLAKCSMRSTCRNILPSSVFSNP